MPVIRFICQYCGHQWKELVYSHDEMPNCHKCKSNKDVKVLISEKDADVFGYNK